MQATQEKILSLESEDLKKFFQVFASQLGITQLIPITLLQFSNKFLEKLNFRASEAYIQSHKISVKYLVSYFGNTILISEIKTDQIESLLLELQKTAPKGYRNYFRNFKVLFNNAIEHNYLKENPCRSIKLPKQQRETPKILSGDELKQLLPLIKSSTIRGIVKLAYDTGLRLSEVLNLQWSSVNFTERTMTIGSKAFKTKSRKQRVIPVQNEVFEQLQKLRPKIVELKGHYIFRSARTGNKFTPDYISRKFKAAVREAGLSEDYHFHSLRHSYASNLVRNKVDIYSVRDLLGHSSVAVTQIYAHNDLDTLRRAVAQLEHV